MQDLMNPTDYSTTEGLNEGIKELGISVPRFSLLIGAPEDTVRSWLRGRRPVHPTAAKMLEWMLKGYRPPNWHMTGDDMREERQELNLSHDQLAEALDVETDSVELWESDFNGPPGFVANAIMWLADDQSLMPDEL